MSDSDSGGEEDQAPAAARREPGRQPANEGEEEAVVASLRDRLGLLHSRRFPWVPELYGIPRKDCGIAESTERTALRCVWPWHHHHCTQVLRKETSHIKPAEDMPQSELFGLALCHAESFTATSSNHEQCKKDHIRNFFNWMMGHGVGKNLIKKSKTFFNAHLRAEHYNRMLAANNQYPQLGKASVGDENFAKSAMKDAARSAADREREEFVCIHSNVDKPISPTENRDILLDVFEPKAHGEVAKFDALYRLVFAASYCASAQNMRRGEEHYKQWYIFRYLRRNEELGGGTGPYTHLVKSVQSKHNSVNLHETSGGIPHRNPLCDFAAWHGVLLAYRLIVLKEKFPPLQDYKKLWYVATYPSLTPADPGKGGPDLCARITPSQCRAVWKAFYMDNKISTGYITKQWRHQGYHDADDRGCDQPAIQKLGGWSHNPKSDKETQPERDHCANNVPLRGMVTMAKGDPKNPRHFYLCRFVCVYDEFLIQFDEIATLLDDHKAVADLYKTYRTRKAMCADRVATAHEVGLNALEELRCCFRFLASRPVDPKTLQVLQEEPCFFDKFRYCSTLRHFFDHAAFQSELWKDLCARVRASENAEIGGTFATPPPRRNDMDAFQCHMQSMVGNLANQMTQQNQETRDLVQQVLLKQSAAASVSHSSVPSSNSLAPTGAQRPVFPVPAPPSSTHSTTRKRHRVSHEAVARAEIPSVNDGICPRPRLPGRDQLFNSARDYWRLWKDEYEPMERRWQQQWRNDRQYLETLEDGTTKTKKANTKATWWNERKYVWECIEHWIKNDRMTEEAALAKAEGMYDSCREGTSGKKKPAIRAVHKAFSEEARRLGIHKVGRPKHPHSEQAFEEQFGWADSLEVARNSQPAAASAPGFAQQTPTEAALQAHAKRPKPLDPLDICGPTTATAEISARTRQVFEEIEAERERQTTARQQRPQDIDFSDLLTLGRQVVLPPMRHLAELPRLPEGASTPPERRVRHGPYRPDYTGPRWDESDVVALEALAQIPQLFDDSDSEQANDIWHM